MIFHLTLILLIIFPSDIPMFSIFRGIKNMENFYETFYCNFQKKFSNNTPKKRKKLLLKKINKFNDKGRKLHWIFGKKIYKNFYSAYLLIFDNLFRFILKNYAKTFNPHLNRTNSSGVISNFYLEIFSLIGRVKQLCILVLH